MVRNLYTAYVIGLLHVKQNVKVRVYYLLDENWLSSNIFLHLHAIWWPGVA
jgi:hypothetical protein